MRFTRRHGAKALCTHALRAFVVLLTSFPLLCVAQVTHVSNQTFQQRDQYVNGVLKTLVNSQSSFGSQPLPAVPQDQVSAQMLETRRYLAAFAKESQSLIDELRFEERYSTYVRGLLGDAVNVKATADTLVTRSQGIADLRQLAEEYKSLDQQWRLLAYQLEQTPNLSNNVRQRVKRLNRGNDAIGNQLKLAPQISQRELVYFFAAMGEDLANLAEDVRIDLYTHQQRDQISYRLDELHTRAKQLRLATEQNYPYEDIVTYYKQFQKEWMTLKGILRTIENRYIQRSVSRIAQINDRIHEQLWLPAVIDGEEVLYQATALLNHVQLTAERITMRQLIEQANAAEIFSKSQDFYVLCDRFKRTVETESKLESLRWDFRELDVAWTDLKTIMNPLKTAETIQDVATIENSVAGLRHSLELDTETADQSQSYDLAATLSNLSDLLYRDVHRYVGAGQLSSQFRQETLHYADQFRRSAQEFQASIYHQANAQVLRRESRGLAKQWIDLQSVLTKIPYEQRNQIFRSSQEIGPVMAKLQLIYTY